MKVKARQRSESGVALVVTLGIMALLLVLGLGFAAIMRIERASARNYAESIQARYAARAGLERAMAELKLALEQNPYANDLGPTLDGLRRSSYPNLALQPQRYANVFSWWLVSSPPRDGKTYLDTSAVDGDFLNIDGLRPRAPDLGEPFWAALVREYEDPVRGSRRDLAGRYAYIVIPNTIDLNAAGNLSSAARDFSRNQGWTTSEVDIGGFLGAIGLSFQGLRSEISTPERMAQRLVRHRYGSSALWRNEIVYPGIANFDDNRNNFASVTMTLGNETWEIPGALADGIDNDGDGTIDEANEGLDDPAEYDPVFLLGDNRVIKTVYDLYAQDYLGTNTQATAKENYRKLLATSALTSYDDNKGRTNLWSAARTDSNYDPEDTYEEFRKAFESVGFGTNDAVQLALNLVDFIDADSLPTVITNETTGVVSLGVEATPLLEEVWVGDYIFVRMVQDEPPRWRISHGIGLNAEYVYPNWHEMGQNGEVRPVSSYDADVIPTFRISDFNAGTQNEFFPSNWPPTAPLTHDTTAAFDGAEPRSFRTLTPQKPPEPPIWLFGRNEFHVFDTDSDPSGIVLTYSFVLEIESRRASGSQELIGLSEVRFEVTRPLNAANPHITSYSVDDPRVNRSTNDWRFASNEVYLNQLHPNSGRGGDAETGSRYDFYVKNAPLSSPGELGLMHRGEPWRTIRFDTNAPDTDLRVLDRFTVAYDPASPVYGRVNVNTDNLAALRALFGRLRLENYRGQSVLPQLGATQLAQAVIDNRPDEGYRSLADFAKSVPELYDQISNPTDFDREALIRSIANLITVRPTFTIYAVGQSLAAEESNDPPNEWRAVVTGESALRAFVEYDPTAKKFEIRELRYLTRPLALD